MYWKLIWSPVFVLEPLRTNLRKRVVVDDGLGSYVDFGVDIEANVYS